ncbi:MAG: TonB-dependent receptor domain-containing protein [Blastocatellia bacterium]
MKKSIIRFTTIALALLFLSVCAKAQTQSELTGRVTDLRGGTINGAKVSAGSVSTTTDTSGQFALQLSPGDYELSVTAAGFTAYKQRVNFTATTNLNVALEPASLADRVTVTPTRAEIRLSDAPISVSVLDAEDISNAAAQTVDDLLRQIPGFSIFRRSSSLVANPTTQGVSLRGAGATGASRTLVMADGVPLNDAFGGWVYWDRVPRAAVDSIEVVRGGSSDLYGSDALSGVINLLTKPSANVLNAETSYGTRDTYDFSSFVATQRRKFSFALAQESFGTDGYFIVAPGLRGAADARAASSHSSGFLRLGYDFTSENSIFARGALFREDRNNGTVLQVNDTRSESLVVGGRFRTGDGSNWNLTVFANQQRYHQIFSAVAANRATEALNRLQFVPSRDAGLSFSWSRTFEKHLLVAGADVRGVRGTSDETAVVNARQTTFSSSGGRQRRSGFFIQDLVTISPRWQLSVNARYDNWRDSSAATVSRNLTTGAVTPRFFAARELDAFSPRLSLIFRPKENVSLRAAAYKAFRAPTLNELYRGFRVGNTQTNPNENLTAERLTGGELGASWNPTANIVTRLTGYWTETANPVSNFTLSVTPALITRERRNLGRTRSGGIEAEADFRLARYWQLTAGYLFADATVRRAPQDAALIGKLIPQVPRHQFTLQTVYSHPRFVTAAMQFRASGSQFDDDQNLLSLGSFALIDVTVSKPFARFMEAFIAVQNLLDERYAVARTPLETLGMPRMVRGGVRFRFE